MEAKTVASYVPAGKGAGLEGKKAEPKPSPVPITCAD
jgi:hypothetical protein